MTFRSDKQLPGFVIKCHFYAGKVVETHIFSCVIINDFTVQQLPAILLVITSSLVISVDLDELQMALWKQLSSGECKIGRR